MKKKIFFLIFFFAFFTCIFTKLLCCQHKRNCFRKQFVYNIIPLQSSNFVGCIFFIFFLNNLFSMNLIFSLLFKFYFFRGAFKVYSPVKRRDNISIRYRQVSILRRWSITILSRVELLQDEHSFIIWCRLILNNSTRLMYSCTKHIKAVAFKELVFIYTTYISVRFGLDALSNHF